MKKLQQVRRIRFEDQNNLPIDAISASATVAASLLGMTVTSMYFVKHLTIFFPELDFNGPNKLMWTL